MWQPRDLGPKAPRLGHRLLRGLLRLRRDRRVRLVAPPAQRLRRDSPAPATCVIAFVSDGYGPRDSVDNRTAFALNSVVYRAPFVMVPSSPIELEEMRNKNQFMSRHQTDRRSTSRVSRTIQDIRITTRTHPTAATNQHHPLNASCSRHPSARTSIASLSSIMGCAKRRLFRYISGRFMRESA